MDKIIKCFVCGKDDFKSYDELAGHKLTATDKAHRKDKTGKTWASNYRYKMVLMKKQDSYRSPLTDEQKESKQGTKRILSGKTKPVNTLCLRCKRLGIAIMEVEHVNEPQALKIGNKYVKMCLSCGGF